MNIGSGTSTCIDYVWHGKEKKESGKVIDKICCKFIYYHSHCVTEARNFFSVIGNLKLNEIDPQWVLIEAMIFEDDTAC